MQLMSRECCGQFVAREHEVVKSYTDISCLMQSLLSVLEHECLVFRCGQSCLFENELTLEDPGTMSVAECRYTVRTKCCSPFDGLVETVRGLPGQTEEEVHVDVGTGFPQDSHNLFYRQHGRHPVDHFQHRLIEVLYAQAEAVEASLHQSFPVLVRQVSRMAFDGNLGFVYCGEQGEQMVVQLVQHFHRHGSRTSATIVYL